VVVRCRAHGARPVMAGAPCGPGRLSLHVKGLVLACKGSGLLSLHANNSQEEHDTATAAYGAWLPAATSGQPFVIRSTHRRGRRVPIRVSLGQSL